MIPVLAYEILFPSQDLKRWYQFNCYQLSGYDA